MKQSFFLIVVFYSGFQFHAQDILSQNIKKVFSCKDIQKPEIDSLAETFGDSKVMPPVYKIPTLLALEYFPELARTKIIIKTKSKVTPLSTRPTFIGVFMPKHKRVYVITISTKSNGIINSIIFEHLDLNSQIGVMGHELSHVSYFNSLNVFGFVNVALSHLSGKFVDRYEYQTDYSCIKHGLGYQLLQWSSTVRRNLNRVNWLGAKTLSPAPHRERYMNPLTIQNIMACHPLYLE